MMSVWIISVKMVVADLVDVVVGTAVGARRAGLASSATKIVMPVQPIDVRMVGVAHAAGVVVIGVGVRGVGVANTAISLLHAAGKKKGPMFMIMDAVHVVLSSSLPVMEHVGRTVVSLRNITRNW